VKHSLTNQISTLDALEPRLSRMFGPPYEDERMTEYRLDVMRSVRATLAFMQEHEAVIREAVRLDREKNAA